MVLAEAFLLRLCLKVQNATGVPRSELQKELKIWAVSSIPVFQNHQFFGKWIMAMFLFFLLVSLVVTRDYVGIFAHGFNRGPAEHALELSAACLLSSGMCFLTNEQFENVT